MNNKIKIRVLIASVIILILILTGHEIALRNSEKHLETKSRTDVEAMARPKEQITSDFESEGQEKTTQPETQPEEVKPAQIKLIMIGDMLLHDVVQYTGEMPDGTYNYDHFFTHIKQDIQNADVAVVNQEVIIGGAEFGISGYPDFNCREEVGDALVKAGFDIILHATNHSMDRGQKGIDNCMNFWDSRYPEIKYLGLNRTQEDYENIYVYEKNGFKIAMLNYTYGLNGIALPSDRPYLVNLLNEEKIKRDLQKAEEIADFTIVYPHWGTEYVYEPDESQRRWAQLFADYGADLVLGAHPHVIEPVEWITGASGNQTLVYYSLGNFISAQQAAPRMLGAMAEITLEKDNDGKVFIKDYGVTPLVTHRVFGCGEITTYKLKDYNDELASRSTILTLDDTFSMSMLQNLCRQVFGDLYKE
jgi:Putative enzyme of poly-gamma-glutamate biosynthesis (capsule formation)